MTIRTVKLALPVVAAVIAALAVSIVAGTPEQLPGIALGSPMLLHLERTAACVAILVAIASVVHETSHGRLPTQLTTAGIGYGGEHGRPGTSKIQRELDELAARVGVLEDSLGIDGGASRK